MRDGTRVPGPGSRVSGKDEAEGTARTGSICLQERVPCLGISLKKQNMSDRRSKSEINSQMQNGQPIMRNEEQSSE